MHTFVERRRRSPRARARMASASAAALLALALLLAPRPAWSYGFYINNGNAPGYQAEFDQLSAILTTFFNDGIFRAGEHGNDAFLKSAGTSNAAATRGMGVDTVSRYSLLSVTAQGGIGSVEQSGGGDDSGTNTLPNAGVGAQAALTVSAPAKVWGLQKVLGLPGDRVDLGFNAMKLSIKSLKHAQFDFMAVGMGASYRWIQGSNGWLGRWEGIRLTTGLEFAHEKLTYDRAITAKANFNGYSMKYDTTLGLNLTSNVFTVPFEVTSGVTLLKFLTFVLGFGVDANFGSTNLKGGVGGPIQMTRDSDGAVVGTADTGIDVTAPGAIAPKLIDTRLILGFQANFGPLKAFVRFSPPFGAGSTGVESAGVRVAF